MDLFPPPLKVFRRVEFAQTDAAGIMHFSTYYFFMESAEAELFRILNADLLWKEAGLECGFPRVDSQCRFLRPVQFGDEIRIELRVAELTHTRIRYAFDFFSETGERCAEGSLMVAAAKRNPNGKLTTCYLPETLYEALNAWRKSAEINTPTIS